MIYKLWLWTIEFRVRRTKDNKKIELLLAMLVDELTAQGHDLRSGIGPDNGNYFTVSDFRGQRSMNGIAKFSKGLVFGKIGKTGDVYKYSGETDAVQGG